jgi:hypothetical protein
MLSGCQWPRRLRCRRLGGCLLRAIHGRLRLIRRTAVSSCDAEHFIEAGGPQAGRPRPPAKLRDGIPVGADETVRPIQPCGLKHGRAAGHHVADHVPAGVGGTSHQVVGGTGAGQFPRIAEVDANLEHLGFGLENRGQAAYESLRGKETPALAQVQPEASLDLIPDVGKPDVRPLLVRRTAELDELVTLQQGRSILF